MASESNPQCFYVPTETIDSPPLPPAKIMKREKRKSKSPRLSDAARPEERSKASQRKPPISATSSTAAGTNTCDVCQEAGIANNSVK